MIPYFLRFVKMFFNFFSNYFSFPSNVLFRHVFAQKIASKYSYTTIIQLKKHLYTVIFSS